MRSNQSLFGDKQIINISGSNNKIDSNYMKILLKVEAVQNLLHFPGPCITEQAVSWK